MKQKIHDILNATLGLFRSGENALSRAVKGAQNTFNELKEKGASTQSERAAKMHRSIDEVIDQIESFGNKAGATYKGQLAKAETLYQYLVSNIKQLDLKDKAGSVKQKIEQLRKAISRGSKASDHLGGQAGGQASSGPGDSEGQAK